MFAGISTLVPSQARSGRACLSAPALAVVLGLLASIGPALAVAQSTPTVTMTTSADPASVANMPTFTATVTGDSGGPVPTGYVSFEVMPQLPSNPSQSMQVLLDGTGTATFVPIPLDVGGYGVIGTYLGDTNYGPQISNDIIEYIIAAPGATISGNSSFSPVKVGSTTTVTLTVQFTQAETLGKVAVLTQGVTGRDFTGAGGTCVAGSYSASATCTVRVKFAPKVPGTRYGAVVLTDNTGNVIVTSYLQGTGTGPLVTFHASVGTDISLASPVTVESSFAPAGLAVDAAGNIYSTGNGLLQKWTPQSDGSYTSTTIPTPVGISPVGVAVDGIGNLYFTDTTIVFPAVQKGILSNGTYNWVAVGYGFKNIVGAAVDGAGNIYVADSGHGSPNPVPAIYKETLQPDGSYVQSLMSFSFISPSSIAVDGLGNLYISDDANQSGSGAVYKETLSSGNYTQTTIGSGWIDPTGLALDGLGNVYVAGINSSGAGQGAFKETLQSDGSYVESAVGFFPVQVDSLAADGNGNFYFGFVQTNLGGQSMVKLPFATPPSVNFNAVAENSTDPNAVITVPLTNSGNADLTISAISYPNDFVGEGNGATPCTTSTAVTPVQSCTLGINFAPLTPLNGQASLTLNENVTIAANTTSSIVIPVSGLETPPLTATPQASVPSGTYTSAQSVSFTDTTTGAAIYYTTNGATPTTSSTLYTAPIMVTQTETIQAIAVASGDAPSTIFSATYTLPVDFSVGAAPASVTISSGNPQTVTVSITPQNSFASVVSFTCSGLPTGASCSFSPPTVTPSGGVASTTLTLSTTMAANAARSRLFPVLPGGMLALALCWLSLPKKRRLRTSLGLMLLGVLPACGGGSSTPIRQPITATVTVTATSGSLQHTTTFSLTEQ